MCAYSSTNANAIVTTDNVTRLLVSIYNEETRQMTEIRTRPERNIKGFKVWYPPQKKETIVAEINVRTINGFR
ncbi:unnamed protein product [marine sediment metagenome]|uniref:Uncharacterized protein n=1 Tax=marine sediment metagenome TaxID=412755 RepID=X0WBY1_9ZZZZ